MNDLSELKRLNTRLSGLFETNRDNEELIHGLGRRYGGRKPTAGSW